MKHESECMVRMNAVRASPPKSFRRFGRAKPTGKSIADWQYWVSRGHRLQLTQAYRKLTLYGINNQGSYLGVAIHMLPPAPTASILRIPPDGLVPYIERARGSSGFL
jgi:hypothetical protein